MVATSDIAAHSIPDMLQTADTADRWTIRDATADDLPELARLMADAPLLQRYATTYAQAVDALQQAHATGDVLLVLEDLSARRPSGLAWLIFTRAFDAAAYLRLLLIEQAAQHAGAGTRMMQAIEARARGRARHLFLMVTRDNIGARRFYERLGLRAVGALPAHVRPDLDEVLYHKPLRG